MTRSESVYCRCSRQLVLGPGGSVRLVVVWLRPSGKSNVTRSNNSGLCQSLGLAVAHSVQLSTCAARQLATHQISAQSHLNNTQ